MIKVPVFLTLFLFFSFFISGQDVTLYESNKIRLEIDTYTNNYCIWEEQEYDLFEPPIISQGKIVLNGDTITCFDTNKNKRFVFKKMDKYRSLVIMKKLYMKSGTIFYVIKKSENKGNRIEEMSWKNGKKDGFWCNYTDKGIKFVVYKNGIVVKRYFKTYKQVYDESKWDGELL